MGSPRRTTRHIEAVEAHGEEVQIFVLVLNDVTADGQVEPHEGQLLDQHVSRLLASYRPLPAEAAVIDGGVRIVGAMLNTLSPTTWTERLVREAATDEQGLIDEGLIEAIAA